MHRIVLSLIFAVSFAIQLSAQVQQVPSSGKPIRDQQAVDAVQSALDALGGAANVAQSHTWQIQGQTQALMPDGTQATGTFTWESDGTELRIASTLNAISGYLVTGHGSPAFVNTTSNGALIKIPPHVINATFVPAMVAHLLLQQLNDAACPLRYGGSTTVGSTRVTVVKTTLVNGSTLDPLTGAQVWYFDNSNHLPIRIDFKLPSQQRPDVFIPSSLVLSNYQSISGVFYPFQIVLYHKNKQVSASNLRSVNVNANLSASDFDAPVGGAQ